MNSIEHQTASFPMFTQVIEHRPDHTFVQPQLVIDPRFRKQISRKLFPNELVKRHVVIENTDEIIAIFCRNRSRCSGAGGSPVSTNASLRNRTSGSAGSAGVNFAA